MASVPSIASTASTMPCCTTQPWPTSAAPSARVTADAAGDVGHRLRIGRRRAQQAARPDRLGQDFVRADDPETFLAQHAHHRGEQPVIAGEGGAADAGQQAGPLGIRAQVEQRRAAHRPDQHQVAAGVQPQQFENPARGADAGRARAETAPARRPRRSPPARPGTPPARPPARPPPPGRAGRRRRPESQASRARTRSSMHPRPSPAGMRADGVRRHRPRPRPRRGSGRAGSARR